MNPKHAIFAICLGLASAANAQLSAVMADTNGMIVRPSNFYAEPWSYYPVTFSSLLTRQTGDGEATVTNSRASVRVTQFDNSGSAAVRFSDTVAHLGPSGAGTAFATRRFTAWVLLDAVPRVNGIARVVVGNDNQSISNVAIRPTTEFVGYEIRETSGNTNEIRIIAHNGTTAVNSSWVTLGSLFDQYSIGVESSRGTVKLWAGVLPSKPSVIATITNGPSSNADIGDSAFDFGLFASNTNVSAIGATVYNAWIQVLE
jgi:hypothetical protein